MGAGTVAVVAHRRKTFGGGLDELRKRVTDECVDELLWYEVSKSRKAGKKARKALGKGADLIFVWGGDGTVQRCIDALAGSDAAVAIVPAGTANMLAGNLGIPQDLPAAVSIGFHGPRRKLDLGKVNGEHFAVMAGAGLDGGMIRDADRGMKDRAGRLAYVWTALKHVRDDTEPVKIRIDGTTWFDGKASCVLVGNVGTITGGIRVFDRARTDDGWLEIGVATARGALQWARTFGRIVAGRPERSPFVRTTRAKRIDVRARRPIPYELDGGDRGTTTRLKVRVAQAAITVCLPE